MVFAEKKIVLRDGRVATLKTPDIEDAQKMLAYIRKASGETIFLNRYSKEWDRVTIEDEQHWIQDNRGSDNTLVIACYIDGSVVGSCQIEFKDELKASHRAVLGIAVLKEYWRLGIASAMFDELIAAAQARPCIEIVELEFLEGNTRAQALYEKYGFKIVGERPNAFKLKDGRMMKEYFMQKALERAEINPSVYNA